MNFVYFILSGDVQLTHTYKEGGEGGPLRTVSFAVLGSVNEDRRGDGRAGRNFCGMFGEERFVKRRTKGMPHRTRHCLLRLHS